MAKKNTPKRATLCAALTALTSSYVAKGGDVNNVIHAQGWDQLVIYIDYTKGDETQLDFKIQTSDTLAFTDAYESVVQAIGATGVSDCLDGSFKRTSSGKFKLAIANEGNYIKILFKATGGTPTGTFGAKIKLENIDR